MKNVKSTVGEFAGKLGKLLRVYVPGQCYYTGYLIKQNDIKLGKIDGGYGVKGVCIRTAVPSKTPEDVSGYIRLLESNKTKIYPNLYIPLSELDCRWKFLT